MGFDDQADPVVVKLLQSLVPMPRCILAIWADSVRNWAIDLIAIRNTGRNSTYSFAPSYRLTDDVKLFGSVTTGFKAPTLDELFGRFGANPELEPQTSLYTNIGAEAYLADQSVKLSAQYFVREIDDLIIYSSAGFINRDRQNDRGVEVSATGLQPAVSRLADGITTLMVK